jgi:hypothetical protein
MNLSPAFPVRTYCPRTRRNRFTAAVIYARARERLSIHLDNGIDLDYYYDSIDGIAWHRGDRLAISVRSDKLLSVVARDAGARPRQRVDADADQDAGPARAESSPSGRLSVDKRAKVQVR